MVAVASGLVAFCLLAGTVWHGREPNSGKRRGPNSRPPGKWWIHIYFDFFVSAIIPSISVQVGLAQVFDERIAGIKCGQIG